MNTVTGRFVGVFFGIAVAAQGTLGPWKQVPPPKVDEVVAQLRALAAHQRWLSEAFQDSASTGGVGGYSSEYCRGRADSLWFDAEAVETLAQEFARRQPVVITIPFGKGKEVEP